MTLFPGNDDYDEASHQQFRRTFPTSGWNSKPRSFSSVARCFSRLDKLFTFQLFLAVTTMDWIQSIVILAPCARAVLSLRISRVLLDLLDIKIPLFHSLIYQQKVNIDVWIWVDQLKIVRPYILSIWIDRFYIKKEIPLRGISRQMIERHWSNGSIEKISIKSIYLT